MSPRTAAAIAASLAPTPQKPEPTSVRIPIGTGNTTGATTVPSRVKSPVTVEDVDTDVSVSDSQVEPIVIDSDDDIPLMDDDDDDDSFSEVMEDVRRETATHRAGAFDPFMVPGMGMDFHGAGPRPIDNPRGVPMNSPWANPHELMDRMAQMMDGPGFGMRAPLGGRTGEVLGYVGPGQFVQMYIAGREKTSLLEILNSKVVLPYNWRLSFPSRAMGNASPLHYPNAKLEDAIDDAKQQNLFLAVHIFNTKSESSDFYNMIVSQDEVQGVYADNYISYYTCVEQPIELHALSRLLAPSQARPTTIALPVVLLMATMKGRLYILDIADSTLTSAEYLDKLLTLRMTHLPTIEEEAVRAAERRTQTTLVDEQNSAFEQSMKRDQEIAAREEAEAARAARIAQEEALAEAAAKQLAADQAMFAANARSAKRQQYLDELQALPPEPTTGKNTTIALRMTDGTKVQRKFDPEHTTLAQVFSFAAGCMAQRATDDSFTDPSDSTQPWSVDAFDFSAQFPARRFTHAQASKSLKELGLAGQELLNLVETSK